MIDFLSNTVLARDLNQDELSLLSKISTVQTFFKNELIFNEQETVDCVYLLLEGRVQIERNNKLKNRIFNRQLLTIKAGQVFGEMAFIEKGLRSASARAKSHVKVVTISSHQLTALMQSEPVLGYKLMTNFAWILSQRLRRMNDQWLSKVMHTGPVHEF